MVLVNWRTDLDLVLTLIGIAINSDQQLLRGTSFTRNVVGRVGLLIRIQGDMERKICQHRLRIEVGFLCVIIIGVWILLSLPILFYHLPISEVRSVFSTTLI